jgi:PPOX class probable FMN-dependent enzyme
VSPDDVLAGYPAPRGRAVAKEIDALDGHCVSFLAMCPFVVLSTAGEDGDPDLTPRGGPPGFVRVVDPHTLLIPDLIGNNRLDNLRKVAANPRVAMLCMVPGIDETLRIYGMAELRHPSDSPVELLPAGRPPRSVLVISVDRAFLHCAKALMRSRLWDPTMRVEREVWPSTGEILRDHTGITGPIENQADMRRRYAPDL